MVLIIDYKFLVLFRVSAILTEYQDLKIKNRELAIFSLRVQFSTSIFSAGSGRKLTKIWTFIAL